MEANRSSGAGATISLPAGTYTLTIPASGSDDETNGDLNFTAPTSGSPVIKLVGAGAANSIIDGNQIDDVIKIAAGRTVEISGVTIRNGYAVANSGGGIANAGTLTITDCVLYGNHSDQVGGGIDSTGSLTMTACTVTQNNATRGGGVSVQGGSATVAYSTVSVNSAPKAAGVYVLGPYTITIYDSTIAGNAATQEGGGIGNDGTMQMYSSTVAFNSSGTNVAGSSGSGIFDYVGGTTNLHNSLVAGNTTSGSPSDCAGTISSYGGNLFGSIANCTVSTLAGSWSTLNSLAYLGPLQINGGRTETIALLPLSNAIDGGDPGGCIGPLATLLRYDQRGYARAIGSSCDVGAFESGDTVFASSFEF